MPKLQSVKAPPSAEEPPGDAEPPAEPEAPKKATGTAKKASKSKAPGKAAAPSGSLLSAGRALEESDDFVNALYTGDAKTGKTTDCAFMANLGKVVYINAEGGVKKGPLTRLGVNTDNIVLFPPDPEDLTFDYLEDLYWELKGALADDPTSWAGTIWDSVTEIHTVLLQNVRNYMNGRARRKGVSRTKDAEPGDLVDSFFTDLSDYNVMTEQMRLLLRRFRDLPCHFAATTLLRRDKDDDGHVVYRPSVTPALGKDMLGYFDVIAVNDIIELDGEECYRGLFRTIGKHRGGDRFGVLPRRLYDPTFDRVVQYVNGTLEMDEDPVMQQVAELARREGIDLQAKRADAEEDDEEVDLDDDSETEPEEG